MDSFQLTVLTIAFVILVLILTIVGVMISKNKTVVFPPISNTCPDFWEVSTDGTKCVIPLNGSTNSGNLYAGSTLSITSNNTNTSSNLYTSGYDASNNLIDFNDVGWTAQGLTSICQQKNWASGYNVTWDGVSNYNSC